MSIVWRRMIYRLFISVALGVGLVGVIVLCLRVSSKTSWGAAKSVFAPTRGVPASGIITIAGHDLLRDGNPFEARGINYYPKDYGWDRLWISYTAASTQIETELDVATGLGVNAVRIFVPYQHFDGSQSVYLERLSDLMQRLQAHDMAAIVTLFDMYATTASEPYSMTRYSADEQHISTVISTLGITNPTVLAWDIKNELDSDYRLGREMVTAWAVEMISYTRSLDPNHLITIGFNGAVTGTPCYSHMITDTLVYSPNIPAELASLVDVVSMHYFVPERCFEHDLHVLQALLPDKPILLQEFGLHTLLTPTSPCQPLFSGNDRPCDIPHSEVEQAAYVNALLSLAEANDVAGSFLWTLVDSSYVPEGLKESDHCMGILRNSVVTMCETTSTSDYGEKPAAEAVRRHYSPATAYVELFDGWVVPNTDAPPPGWSDSWISGGALLRGYDPTQLLWSHTPGRVALSNFVSGSIPISNMVLSPVLMNIDIDHFPFLTGQVDSYSVRDRKDGSHSRLYVGVQAGGQVTRLLTITPDTPLPYTFAINLRKAPIGWHGRQSFQIALELVPEGAGNGYSATYELDWVGVEKWAVYLPLVR